MRRDCVPTVLRPGTPSGGCHVTSSTRGLSAGERGTNTRDRLSSATSCAYAAAGRWGRVHACARDGRRRVRAARACVRQALCAWRAVCMRVCEPAGLLQIGCDCAARLVCMLCRIRTLLHAFVVCDVVRALPTRGPTQRVVACTVTMCADVCEHKLDQWRSSSSSTDISITTFDFKEGQLTLLTRALHRR